MEFSVLSGPGGRHGARQARRRPVEGACSGTAGASLQVRAGRRLRELSAVLPRCAGSCEQAQEGNKRQGDARGPGPGSSSTPPCSATEVKQEEAAPLVSEWYSQQCG